MKQKLPSFRFPLVMVAIIFLATPNISLVGILPDFIGYLLLTCSLSYAADAFPYFAEAKAGFLRLMWISLAKIPASLIMLMMWGNDSSQRSIVAVFSLSFAVLDLVFLLPTLSTYFEGVFYLGDRYGCDSVMGVPSSFGKLTREGFKKLTVAFMITKEVMSTLPEMTLISVKQYNPDYVFEGSRIVWSAYYPLFAIVGAVLVLAFGVVWAAYALRYCAYLKQADEIDPMIVGHYEKEREYLYTKRDYARVAMGLLLLIVAVGFAIDFVLDDVNVVPDATSVILFVIGIQLLRPSVGHGHISSLLFGLYGLASVVANVFKISFVSKYTYRMIETVPAAASLYTQYSIVYVVETVLACVAFASLCGLLKDLYKKYAPKAFEGNEKKLSQHIYAFVGLGWLSAIGSLLYVLSMRYTKPVETAVDEVIGVLTFPKWEWFWMVPLLLALAWLVYSISFLGNLRDSIKEKAEW